MNQIKLAFALALVLTGAFAIYYVSQEQDTVPTVSIDPDPRPEEEMEAEPPRYTVPDFRDYVEPEDKEVSQEPVTQATQDQTPKQPEFVLPSMEKSDEALQRSLPVVSESNQFLQWLLLNNMISRFVVTVDNMTNKTLPKKYQIVKPAPGPFSTQKLPSSDPTEAPVFRIADDNAERYKPYVELLQGLKMRSLLRLYVQYYPLFQQAYEDLGYPDRYFNNRVVEVIEHLRQTPEVVDPVLVQPKVAYQYADPKLERLSAGQKILIRMGPDNARQFKDFLTVLRDEILALSQETAATMEPENAQ